MRKRRPVLRVHAATGELRGATQLASPNCDARPPGIVPGLVVVHGISLPPGEFGGPWIDRLFCNTLDPAAHPAFADLEGLRVSSHLLIRRDGKVIQYVPLDRRAWHAGRSRFAGRDNCNDFSVGIELEGTDDGGYTEAQYQQLAALAQRLMQAYPEITPDRIVGHADIAPGRKSDPGAAFDWSGWRARLRSSG